MNVVDIDTDTLRQELAKRDKERMSAIQAESAARRALEEANAAIGREDALKECEQLIKEVEAGVQRIEELSRKHFLNLTVDFGSYGLNFSRWGIDGDGWESSSC